MTTIPSFDQLSDHDLLAQVRRATRDERHATAHLIALLIELDARKLYLGEGCSSLFTYCTQQLHLSEHAAYLRIEAARAAFRLPLVLERLADGSITLTAIGLLAPHLTADNHRRVLDAATHKRKSDVEHLVATLRPQPDVAATVRKLPERNLPVASESAIIDPPCESLPPVARPETTDAPVATVAAHRRAEAKPLAPKRYKIQFTASRECYERLRRAQDLLRHSVPNGDPAVIFERALALFVLDLERRKTAATEKPRNGRATAALSRHIPAAVRRAVWQRDGGRCAFRGTQGRCSETGWLEFHHVRPFAAGGEATVNNIELRCRAHNVYEADQFFGPRESLFDSEVPAST
jgi:hypothetical protein